MQLRTTETLLMDGRQTDIECHECDEATFVKRGHEMWCPNCSYAPSRDEPSDRTDPWDVHRNAIEERLDDDEKGRPRLVGGFKGAYRGDGEYCFSPSSGFNL